MSPDDDLAEEARKFLKHAICELHPPGATRDEFLAWADSLTTPELLLPNPRTAPRRDRRGTH